MKGESVAWRRGVSEQALWQGSRALPGTVNRRRVLELPHLLGARADWERLAALCLANFAHIRAAHQELGWLLLSAHRFSESSLAD